MYLYADGTAFAIGNAYFGPGYGAINMDNVLCQGSEDQLTNVPMIRYITVSTVKMLVLYVSKHQVNNIIIHVVIWLFMHNKKLIAVMVNYVLLEEELSQKVE